MTTSIDATKIDKIKAFNTKQAEKNTNKSEALLQSSPKPPPPPGMSKDELIAEEAARTKAVRDKEKVDEAARKKQEEEKATLLEKSKLQADKALELAKSTTQEPRKWLESLPTPGGIATIIVILLFFLFAVIPVDSQGNTRLKLLWLSIRGNTHLAYTETTASPTKEVISPSASGKNEDVSEAVDLSIYRGVDFSLINLFE